MLLKAIYIFIAIPVKIPLAFFRAGTKNPKICMESEKTLKSQRDVEKENQSWWHQDSQLQAILQSYNHQDSMVLAKKGHIG